MEYKIFFGKFSGKSISELPSNYLVWIIEYYSDADWTLIRECKQELSYRLSLDWKEPEPEIPKLKKQISVLSARIHLIESLLTMSEICKGNSIILQGYEMNQVMLEMDLQLIKEINM